MSSTKIGRLFNKMRDILIADVMYTIPYLFKWLYNKFITKQITSTVLKKKSHARLKTACLYSHDDHALQNMQETRAILFMHGIYGHPLSLLHFIDLAKQFSVPIFSIHLNYDAKYPERHRVLLRKGLDEIERLIAGRGGRLKGVVAVGHSLGAIESAYQAFVVRDERITAVVSIAGRLKIEPAYGSCRKSLKVTVDKVYEGIQQYPHTPLYQIVAECDWNAPLEATIVRSNPKCFHIVPGAMHFNILYHHETLNKLAEFLKASLVLCK